MGSEDLTVVADRGYFKGVEILACEEAGITAFLPKPQTSGSQAEGRFGKRDFHYIPEDDEYRCPAGERLKWRMTTVEKGQRVHRYWTSACPSCSIKARCTPSPFRRVTRWEHEEVIEAVQARLDRDPEKMRVRRHGRASLWDDKSVDGVDALPHQNARAREYRDEFACPGLQSEACDEPIGRRSAHRSDTGMSPVFLARRTTN